MADHQDLVAEMAAVEKMATQDRLKHAKKRRTNQLKKWANYEKQLEKENSKRKKYGGNSKRKKNNDMPQGRTRRIRFPGKIVLLEAAARNDLEDVRRLLQQGVNPDSTNEDGLTALHQCCIDDSEDMLKLLLEFGANVNAQDSELWTPLHAAATCGHVHLCKHLIDKGANLLAVNADGNMPYDICEDEVTLDYIETEMARRGITQEEIDETRLIPEKNMLDDMKFIAQKKGNLEYLNDEGTTPLHIAAANGYLEVGKFLLDHHVSVDKRDYNGWQPIHAAACWLQPEFLELLVKNGADIDAKTRNGETPFDLCEDAEIKQKILDMKDEIENNKLINSRGSVKKHKHNTRSSTNSMYSSTTSLNDKSHSHGARHRSELHHSASIRRSSMRGEKNPLFMKEAKEEAMHFGWRKDDENDEDIVEDEKENNSIMQLDDVELIIDDDISRNKPAALKETSLNGDLEDLGSARPQKGFADTIELRHQKLAKTQSDSASSRSPKQGQRSSHTEVTQRPRSAAAPDAPRSLPLATEDNSGAPASTGIVKRSSFTRKSEMVAKKAEEERMLQQQQQKFPETLPEENSPTTPTEQDVRYPSGTPSATLSDLKKHRSEKRNSLENSTLDTQVQNLFLSSLNSNNKKYSSSSLPQRDQNASAPAAPNSNSHQGVKNKNGHNNNMESYNNNSQSLRRFVAPSSAPAVGGEEKDGCCVIL